MTETATPDATTPPTPPTPGLLARAIGVITSPGEMFPHIVRAPKVVGMIVLVGLAAGLAQGLPQLTEKGRAAALEAQVRGMERFGMTVTDEMYQQMEQRSHSNFGAYATMSFSIVGVLIGATIVTALLWAVFNTVMGGTATFKQVMAVLVHSQVISTLGAVFAAPIMYARGTMSQGGVANLGALLPMIDETSFAAKFLGMVDLFNVWWVIVLSIGLGTLYKRKTSSIATGLFVVYGVVAATVAYFTAG